MVGFAGLSMGARNTPPANLADQATIRVDSYARSLSERIGIQRGCSTSHSTELAARHHQPELGQTSHPYQSGQVRKTIGMSQDRVRLPSESTHVRNLVGQRCG
jgi:hypothetical protein